MFKPRLQLPQINSAYYSYKANNLPNETNQ